MNARAPAAPRSRTIGVVYLLYFVTAVAAQVLTTRGLVAFGNIVNMIATLLYVATTVLFYFLFRPVNQGVALLAMTFGLAGCVITGLNTFELATSVSPLLFFGPFNILVGYLILKSTILPKTLGVLMQLSGVGWLLYLTPLIVLSTPIKVVGIAAEGLLMLWLLVVGVRRR
jgi:hypothetical protein